MTNEQYIEHEVQLRVHSELFKVIDNKHEDRFKRIDNDIKGIKSLLFSIIGIGVTSIILPIFLHVYRLI